MTSLHPLRKFLFTLRALALGTAMLTALGSSGCQKHGVDGSGGQIATVGVAEVTAKLVEIRGELPADPLYDYAFVFKYEVQKVHRGQIADRVIYVAHYLPLKPRNAVTDARSGPVNGDVEVLRAGDVHRLALEFPVENHYMGGLVNRYFDDGVKTIYSAVWTNRVLP